MKRLSILLITLLCFAAAATGLFAQESPANLLPNGNFEKIDSSGNPIGWKMAPPNTHIEAEGANHYLVVEPKSNNAMVNAETFLTIDPSWAKLHISARVRGRNIKLGKESWQGLQLGLRFYASNGNELGYGGFTILKDIPWTTMTSVSEIPVGAVRVQIYPASFGVAGEFSIDDIEITAVPKPKPEDGILPVGERITWGEEPIEKTSSLRGEMVLNGIWKFQPAIPGEKQPETTGWGYIRVPGSWRNGYSAISIPGMVSPGTGQIWESWKNDTLTQGWYERPLRVPAEWQDSVITLDLSRVSTEAWVYVDGKEAGRAGWPGGEVDITKFITPGKEQQLRVFVAAIPDQEQVGTFMGPGAGQISFSEAKLESKGLVDDVVLRSRPSGAHVSDIFVRPSVRHNQISLDVELTGVEHAGPVQIVARMERNGKVEKNFEKTVEVKSATIQTLTVSWPWTDPALWDLDKPELYTLKLSIEGNGLKDEYGQSFGFREFWVDGRILILNGIEFRMRPQCMPEQWSGVSGTRESIEGVMKGMRWAGYNIGEMWPYEAGRRGMHNFHEAYYTKGDQLGFPLMGSAGSMSDFIFWGQANWKSPAARIEWERLTQLEIRRSRNHPSVLIWSSSGNAFGHAEDQHPLAIGRDGWYTDPGLKGRANVLESGLTYMRGIDPTRPAFIHQAILGDLYSVNNYLDFTPLQEREEWLSSWAVSGTKPYVAIEFGTPLDGSYMRGRSDYGQSMISEPLLTEFAAIYFGPEAYRMETPEYRSAMREHLQKDQTYSNWQNNAALDFSPPSQAIQDLFVRNTWRSWRAWGITGGMVPWSAAHGWQTVESDEVDAPPFKAGRRGTWFPKLAKRDLYALRPEGGMKILPAAQALIANNSSTLAYIGGKAPTFTDKQHSFWSAAKVDKQIVLINDERSARQYSASWQVKAGGNLVASGAKNGVIAPAQNLFIPFTFSAPKVTVRTDAQIVMEVKIGANQHKDIFLFRIFPRLSFEQGTLAVFDPVGKTTAMLHSLGYNVYAWKGNAIRDVLVIGREALSGGGKLPGNLESFVRNGGRAILFSQKPVWMERAWGVRVSKHISRRVFPVDARHPAMSGLDSRDLTDWAGESDLISARAPLPDKNNEELYGWRWGNRGGVSSAAIEKPHLAGWRPLLECEFDGAYTPLMELDYGKGRLTFCMLDLEGRTTIEPAADRIARNILRNVRKASLPPNAVNIALIGTMPGWYKQMGVMGKPSSALSTFARLAIIAPDSTVSEAELNGFLNKGGKVVFLQRKAAAAPLGITLEERNSSGSVDVPKWDIAAGLSPSDLRWRTENKAWLIKSGAEIGAGGQIAMRHVGKGVAVWLQFDPERFNADINTYFRFTRWRQTRAIAQVLANMGASFRSDSTLFSIKPSDSNEVALAGTWDISFLKLIPPAASADSPNPDPGISEAATQLVAGKGDAIWEKANMPEMLPAFQDKDGEAVARRVVIIPAKWAGQDLKLALGTVDDFDQTFWNGEKIGETDIKTPNFWGYSRLYTIPGRLVKAGKNVLAVRIWDHYGGGGFAGRPDEMVVHRPVMPTPGLYHPDYRSDFVLGDDPFRYKRW